MQLLHPGGYYWTFRETETATDIMFRDAQSLAAIYPYMVRHAMEHFSCEDVLRFLGRRTNCRFAGEVNTEMKRWVEGIRVRHRVEENSIKMYDKQGSVLRIETTIVNPERFRVRREVTRNSELTLAWVPMRKDIMDTARRAETGRAANERYLEALGVVGEPSPTRQLLDPVSKRTKRRGRPYRGLRPVDREDIEWLTPQKSKNSCQKNKALRVCNAGRAEQTTIVRKPPSSGNRRPRDSGAKG
jgi:hypothetical protein